jgi:hypothetical protein
VKLYLNVVIQVIGSIVAIGTKYADVVPVKYQPVLAGLVAVAMGLSGILAHFYNPDGTAASEPFSAEPRAATAYVDAMTPTASLAPPIDYVRKLEQQIAVGEQQNRHLREQLAQNSASRQGVQDETTERLDNLRHRPAPDRLRGDV